MVVCVETIGTNELQAWYRHMSKQTSDELGAIERHRLVVTALHVPKRHRTLGDGDQSAVADRAAANVSAEIIHYVLRIRDAALNVHVPFLRANLPQHLGPRGEFRRKSQLPARDRALHSVQKYAAKIFAGGLCRKKEITRRSPCPVQHDPSGRYKAMDMGMKIEASSPRLKRCDNARQHSQTPPVFQKFEQGFLDGGEEYSRHDTAPLFPERIQLMGDREDDVKVRA